MVGSNTYFSKNRRSGFYLVMFYRFQTFYFPSLLLACAQDIRKSWTNFNGNVLA